MASAGWDCGVGSGERSGGRSSAPSERGVAMHKGAGWASEGHREEALTRAHPTVAVGMPGTVCSGGGGEHMRRWSFGVRATTA